MDLSKIKIGDIPNKINAVIEVLNTKSIKIAVRSWWIALWLARCFIQQIMVLSQIP